MKKLLIIQTDEAYFLFETFQVLDRFRDSFKDFELTILTDAKALSQIEECSPKIKAHITTSMEAVLTPDFDLSVNLSMNEASWPLHGQIKAAQKIGPFEVEKQLMVPDVWSSFLLTLKGRAPFLTFHMQDLYKNILGVRKIAQPEKSKRHYKILVFGLCNTDLFPAEAQEEFLTLISSQFSQIEIKDITEIDLISDLSHILYVVPATLDSLKLCESGANGIFLTSQFQGFNLLPHHEGHLVVSSRHGKLKATELFPLIKAEIKNEDLPENFPYSAYQIDEENLFGSYLRSLNNSDDNYPVYQSHVVLWNFILNLFDINLEVIRCHEGQIQILQNQLEVLQKLVRLYDYAMSSIDTIHHEAKASVADQGKIQGHLNNLREIETITDKISQSNIFLRPILDFYRIRRGQNQGSTLLEQAQHSFLTYSEEHQALKAIQELFTVTLRKNEVSI